MRKIKLKLKTDQEIWAFDKSLLRGYNPALNINWSADLPSDQEALKLLVIRNQCWKNPLNSFKLDKCSLEKTLEWLIPSLEEVWGTALEEQPEIEIVPIENYLPRINELEKKTDDMFGYKTALTRSPPTMYLFSSHGILVIPERFLVREPKKQSQLHPSGKRQFVNSTMSSDYNVQELEWDKAHFEEVLSEELSHALFRQQRGEWKQRYVECMKNVGPDKEQRISIFNEVIALYVKEKLTELKHSEWGLYVATEKISIVWGDRYAREDYRSVDALHACKNLSQIACVDDFSLNHLEGEVIVDFYHNHPYSLEKQRRFEMD